MFYPLFYGIVYEKIISTSIPKNILVIKSEEEFKNTSITIFL